MVKKDFYEKFNLKPEEFHNRFNEDFQISGSFRKDILKSELNDFEYLSKTVQEINDIQKKLLDRFKIEGRNSFSGEVRETYIELIMGTENLRILLQEKQLPFYQKRIDEIKDELKNLEK